MRFFVLALAAVPVFVSGAELTAHAALKLVPSVPDTAHAAYAQWIPDAQYNSIKPGPALKAYEEAVQAQMMAKAGVVNAKLQQQAPQMNAQMTQQMAMAQKMQQQYGSPEGQAKLKSMTPAELMAMAQQMQAPHPASAPVSDHDQALMAKINVYEQTQNVQAQVLKVREEQVTLDKQWRAERDALNQKKEAEYKKLKICADEAGEPSSLDVRTVERKYADQRIALASQYLPKYKVVEQHMRAAIAPRIEYGDQAMVAWSQLEGAGVKEMTAQQAQSAQSAGIADVGQVLGIVHDASRQAADEIVERKRIEEIYKDAQGC